MKKCVLIVLMLALFTSFSFSQTQTDSLALVALYDSTNGPGWTNNDGWLQPGVPISEWHGVSCWNEEILIINLEENNLNGTLPKDLFNITSLRRLYLMGNNIKGGIFPKEIGNLVNLKEIILNGIHFTGTIPSSIGGCISLQSLHLSGCGLSGVLPNELCSIPLTQINLEANYFDSQSCETIQCLADHGVNFVSYAPSQEQMDGTLLLKECPVYTGQCLLEDSLALVDLFLNTEGENWIKKENWLTAPVYTWEGVLVRDGRVKELNLVANNINGTLPESIFNLTSLWRLDLRENELLEGQLLPEVGSMVEIAQLMVSGTHMGGVIPNNIGYCSELGIFAIGECNFEGLLPIELCNTKIFEADFAGNYFDSQSCPTMECLTEKGVIYNDPLQIQKTGFSLFLDCGLTPDLPPCNIQDSLALVALYDSTNGDGWINNEYWLTEFPVSLWNGVVVEEGRVINLYLVRNNLNGTLPNELGNLTEFMVLNLMGNQISGEIPMEIGQLQNLQTLGLQNNQFSGMIPAELGELKNLQMLYLNNNQLSGQIPSEIGHLENLIWLNFLNNKFTGNIPAEFGQLNNLKSLILGYNELTGIIPYDLCTGESLISANFSGNHFDSQSCSTIKCMLEKGIFFFNDLNQTQQTGFSLVNDCRCTSPVIEEIIGLSDPVAVGNIVTLSSFVSGEGIEAAVWDWGDGSTSTSEIAEEIVGEHIYFVPGVYVPKLTLSGCNEEDVREFKYVVIFDSEGSFVVGNGIIESPVGASVLLPNSFGEARFGFVSKYESKEVNPDGNTDLKFSIANFNFEASGYEWLVIAGAKA